MIPSSGPQRVVFFGACTLAVVGAVISTILVWNAVRTHHQQTEQWLASMERGGQQATQSLNEDLRVLSARADRLADWVEAEQPTIDQIERRLEAAVDESPEIFGIGVGFSPYAYDPDTRLLSRYLIRENADHRLVALEDFYDYTEPIPPARWYQEAIEEPGWLQPVFGVVSETVLVMYCAHFQLDDEPDRRAGANPPDGMACVNYSIEDIWGLAARLGLSETGYPMVITDQGQFVVHPLREYVLDHRDIFELADERDDPELARFGEIVGEERTGFFRYFDPVVEQQSRIYYTPIPETDWTLAAVSYDAEIPRDWEAYRQQQIWIAIAFLITLLAGLVAVVVARRLSKTAMWAASVVMSLALIVGIVRMWHLAGLEVEQEPPDAVMLVDPATVDRVVDDYSDNVQQRYHLTPRQVPTGVAIDSIEIEAPHRFRVSGTIWCHYTVDEHDDLARGVRFPDAVEEPEFQEVMRFRQGDQEVVGWQFQALLNHPSDISWFPLDVRRLPIRIHHPELHRHVVLVPDLEAYSPLYPRGLPGIRHDLPLLGWDVDRAYFAYRFFNYGVDIGPPDISGRGLFPELTYHTVVQRRLVDGILSQMTPLIIALALMFAVAMLETRRREKAEVVGFHAFRVLSVVTAVFFALIVAHIDTRRRFMADELMYLEYFYMITYLMIIIGAINVYMINSPDIHVPAIDYEDNLLPKTMFWPITWTLMFGVTAWMFY